jgi:hypothetical protein
MSMKHRMAISLGVILLVFAVVVSACSRQNNVCPAIEGTPQPKPALVDLLTLPPPDPQTDPITVEIGGKMVSVDKLVEGPLCNDIWSGTVYVGCNIIVGEAHTDADNNPLFLKGCDLKIESGTIVYVAAHNDAAYYKGCSCHTGEDPIP